MTLRQTLAALALAAAVMTANSAGAHSPFRQCRAEIDAWRRAFAGSQMADDASDRALRMAAEHLIVFGHKAAELTPTFAIRFNAAVRAQARARLKQADRTRATADMVTCFKRWQGRP